MQVQSSQVGKALAAHGQQKLRKDDDWMDPFTLNAFIRQRGSRCHPVSMVAVNNDVFFLDVSDVRHPCVKCAKSNQAPIPYGPSCSFNRPTHIAAASDGGLLVTDCGNHRIMHLSLAGVGWSVVAGGNGQGSQSDQLCFPRAAISLEDGSVLVADSNNHRVVHFSKSSREGFVIAGGQMAGKGRHQLHGPCCIAIAPNSDLLVADTLNNRVMHFACGASEGTPLLDDQVLHNPIGIVCTREGGLVVADATHVVHLAPSCRRPTVLVEKVCFPQGVALSDEGHAFVADTDRCQILYIAHRRTLRNLILQLSRDNAESPLASLRNDVIMKVLSFL